MAQGATRKRRQNRQPAKRRFPGAGRVFRRLAGTSLVLGLISMLAAGVWQALQVPVERVMVSGDLRQVSREHLTENVNGSLQGGFLWVDLQKIRASVESLPWVYRVVVKRHWPNSLEIQVVEQLPIARWGDQAYLNHAGELFTPAAMIASDELAQLAGPIGSEAQLMQHYKLIQDQMQPLGLQLEALTMDSRGGLRARLSGGGELVFGRGDVNAKMRRFSRVYRAQLAQRMGQLRSIDLRYSHGVAVAWTDPAVARNQRI
jgi:cell division protein FtsQ